MDSIFFFASKLLWLVVAPDMLLVLLCVVGVFLFWRGSLLAAKMVLSAVTLAVAAITVLPIGSWMIYPLEQRFPRSPSLPDRVDGIIVLSGGVNAAATTQLGQTQVNEQVDRELALLRLARRYPNAKLLYAGGASSLTHQQFKGADAAATFLSEMGLANGRLLLERESRNTFESAVLSKRLVRLSPDETWLLVTSAFHMPRSVGVFCQVGWSVLPYPVDYRAGDSLSLFGDVEFATHLERLTLATREWIGLLAYRVTGKIPTVLPKGCA